ncbi:MAG: ferrous iron transport protein A [Lachnospiraceae bacterium]|nr:ferrous iron transport protein A [Lachnospiraceae bacterium]MCI1328683.1 ferrous iron transport protein A [Lachnospiraceae bacterium]
MPLSMAKIGDRVMVARVGGSAEVKKHLEDLGFVSGAEVSVVSAPGNGNVIIRVKDSTLAVTSKMAEKIFVTM